MENARRTIVVIGAGMAGLTAARLLSGDHEVVVLDKGRGVGGRLATRRIGDATFDHGAQFMTTHTDEFAGVVERLVDEGVVAPWFRGRIGPDGAAYRDGHTRFRGVQSMNAIAKHLAQGLVVRTATQVSALAHDGVRWTVRLVDESEIFADAVLATAPVPQSLALLAAGGTELSHEDSDALNAIAYDPCIALMVVLDGPSGLGEPGAVDPATGPIDWMADNQMKGVSAVPAVTIHSTAEFSRAHWDVTDDEIVETLLAAAGLASKRVPGAMSIHRWRYARPSVEHPERSLTAAGLPPLVFAGDAFGGAKVEGAALSGVAAVRALLDTL